MSDMNDYIYEMLTLGSVYLIINMEQIQNLLRSRLPCMLNQQTYKLNVLGNVINALLLIVVWSISRKLIVKYMKDIQLN